MNHTEYISKYCNDNEILDILQKLGEYLYDLDEDKIRMESRRIITWKEAVCDGYLMEYKNVLMVSHLL